MEASGFKSDQEQQRPQKRRRRQNLTPSERAQINRDRNREHARNTRLRKKAFVEELQRIQEELQRSEENEQKERAAKEGQQGTREANVRDAMLQLLRHLLKGDLERGDDIPIQSIDGSLAGADVPGGPSDAEHAPFLSPAKGDDDMPLLALDFRESSVGRVLDPAFTLELPSTIVRLALPSSSGTAGIVSRSDVSTTFSGIDGVEAAAGMLRSFVATALGDLSREAKVAMPRVFVQGAQDGEDAEQGPGGNGPGALEIRAFATWTIEEAPTPRAGASTKRERLGGAMHATLRQLRDLRWHLQEASLLLDASSALPVAVADASARARDGAEEESDAQPAQEQGALSSDDDAASASTASTTSTTLPATSEGTVSSDLSGTSDEETPAPRWQQLRQFRAEIEDIAAFRMPGKQSCADPLGEIKEMLLKGSNVKLLLEAAPASADTLVLAMCPVEDEGGGGTHFVGALRKVQVKADKASK